MSAFLMTLLKLILTALAPIFVTVCMICINRVTKAIANKIDVATKINLTEEERNKLYNTFESVHDDIMRATLQVKETYVDPLKARNEFGTEAQANARLLVQNALINELLNKDQKKAIEKEYPSLVGYLSAEIEKAVVRLK